MEKPKLPPRQNVVDLKSYQVEAIRKIDPKRAEELAAELDFKRTWPFWRGQMLREL
jgi:hypothetical protein